MMEFTYGTNDAWYILPSLEYHREFGLTLAWLKRFIWELYT